MPELGYAPVNRYLSPRKATIPAKPLERPAAGGVCSLTGFGYGLLAWAGVLAAFGLLSLAPLFLPVAVVVALAFANAGLVASMAHLGHPERAWRAFRQWRSSWVTQPAHCAGLSDLCGIFRSRLLAALWSLWFGAAGLLAVSALVASLIGAGAKFAYWRHIDGQQPLVTLASAARLAAFGTARPLDGPHFTENYILREMGYQIARRHAVKLRHIAIGMGFLVPAILAMLAALGIVPPIMTTVAALVALAGLLVERWLFSAEATHVSTIYYGR